MDIFNYLHKWFNQVGTYRMISDPLLYQHPAFVVEVRGLLRWHIVKVFVSDDTAYARNCAIELLEMLNEEII